jgi:hypothetical protein
MCPHAISPFLKEFSHAHRLKHSWMLYSWEFSHANSKFSLSWYPIPIWPGPLQAYIRAAKRLWMNKLHSLSYLRHWELKKQILQKTRLPLVFPHLGWVLCPVTSAYRLCLPPLYFFYSPSTFVYLPALIFLLYTFVQTYSPLVIPPPVPAVEATMRYTSLPPYLPNLT